MGIAYVVSVATTNYYKRQEGGSGDLCCVSQLSLKAL